MVRVIRVYMIRGRRVRVRGIRVYIVRGRRMK